MTAAPDNPLEQRLHRRDALTLLIAATASPWLAPRDAHGAGPVPGPAIRNPSIARAAAIHDALLLLAADRDVAGDWQNALLPLPVGKVFELSYTYGVASLDDDGRLVRDVVAEVRAGWPSRRPAFMDIQRHKGGMMERRLAVALGCAANHGAARVLFDGSRDPNAEIGVDGVFLRALIGVDTVSEAEARRAFRVLYERALVAMHTLEPDLDGDGGLAIAAMHEVRQPRPEDVNRYLDRYADWVERIDARCEELAAALAGAAPPGLPAGAAFYRPNDPVIAAAERLRRGIGAESPPGHWAQTHGRSRYARAVAAAYGNARLVLEAARGERDIGELDHWPAARRATAQSAEAP